MNNTVASWEAFLNYVFGKKLQLEALSSLPKTVESGLATRPNIIGSGCQARPITFPKGAKKGLGLAGQLHPISFFILHKN
jgi:hypothetical protein